MQSKSLLIAIAAFAVTATGVHAYAGSKVFEKAGLSEHQISALETARELRKSGDIQAARDVLVEAGVDETVLRSIHQITKETRAAIHDAVEAHDYDAFMVAAEGTELAEAIDTEADFNKFVEAHELKLAGKWPEAKEILDELGIEAPHRFPGMHRGMMRGELNDLSDDEKEALRVARQANDKEAVDAILEEAGIERGEHRGMHW